MSEPLVKEIYDTIPAINERTRRAKIYAAGVLEKAEAYRRDPMKKQRLLGCECRFCFYMRHDRIVGWGFTEYTCGICGIKCMWTNTGVPRICPICAPKKKICVYCGSDLNMRKRRGPVRREKINDLPGGNR